MKTILKEYMNGVETDLQKRIKQLKVAIEWDKLSTKLKSELISNALEAAMSKVIPNCEAPTVDSKSDVYINGVALEIKTTSTSYTWQGGEFSKRPADYLLVGYTDDGVGNNIKLFVLHTKLKESDWISSKSDNYYATSIQLKYILKNNKYTVLTGNIQQKRTHPHMVCV